MCIGDWKSLKSFLPILNFHFLFSSLYFLVSIFHFPVSIFLAR